MRLTIDSRRRVTVKCWGCGVTKRVSASAQSITRCPTAKCKIIMDPIKPKERAK